MRFVNNLNARGFSLISALLAVAIIGIASVAGMQSMSTLMSGSSNTADRFEIQAIKKILLDQVSCADTFSSSTCTSAGQLITVKKRLQSGAVGDLVLNDGTTKIGKFTLKAACLGASNDQGILIKGAKLSASGNINSTLDEHFLPDALTKKRVKWSDSASNLVPDIGMCGSQSSGSAMYHCVKTDPCTGRTPIACVGTLYPYFSCLSPNSCWFTGTPTEWKQFDGSAYRECTSGIFAK